jgi:hypothetical protein
MRGTPMLTAYENAIGHAVHRFRYNGATIRRQALGNSPMRCTALAKASCGGDDFSFKSKAT